MTRFVALLGFYGYAESRRRPRSATTEPVIARGGNKFQAAVDADLRNLAALRAQLADETRLRAVAGRLLASVPLVVVGYRVSAARAASFAYLATKIHPDVRLLTGSASVSGDHQGSGPAHASDHGPARLGAVEAMAEAAGASARQRVEGFEDHAADQDLFLRQ
ncbi:hypothetical protein ACFWN1_21530 [Streptomyces sp. NPDC058459]|uniref:hypothetical protein n=1 Tax=Streptomyces sp. NPDC058459 TaxID=3346508 RepID=UPI00364C7F84